MVGKCWKNQPSSSTCIYSNLLFRLIWHKAECLQRDKTHFINLSRAMHWRQTSECVACIHLVTLSRSCSEVQMEAHCWLLQQLFILNNMQSEMNHISFSTVLFGCLMDAEASSCCCLECAGFHKLTLVNTWYGSLRPLFTPEENITMVPTVTDGSQR